MDISFPVHVASYLIQCSIIKMTSLICTTENKSHYLPREVHTGVWRRMLNNIAYLSPLTCSVQDGHITNRCPAEYANQSN